MSDTPTVHLLMPVGRYAATGQLQWLIRFRCSEAPSVGITLTTDRGDVTCPECIEALGVPQAQLAPLPTASHQRLV